MKLRLTAMWLLVMGGAQRWVQYIRDRFPAAQWLLIDEYKVWLREQERNQIAEDKDRTDEFVWCLVGNIVEQHAWGETKEVRKGAKHFSPGTKVYCFPPKWGNGYKRIQVIGRPRGTSRFITVIIRSRLVTNWRIKKVYSDHIKQEMLRNRGWDATLESEKRILEMLRYLNPSDNGG